MDKGGKKEKKIWGTELKNRARNEYHPPPAGNRRTLNTHMINLTFKTPWWYLLRLKKNFTSLV